MEIREAFYKFNSYSPETRESIRKIVRASRFPLSTVVEVYDYVKDLKLVQKIIKTADGNNVSPMEVVSKL
jgi:hypothetical protein